MPLYACKENPKNKPQNECCMGKPRNKLLDECKHSSSLWMNDFCDSSNVWMNLHVFNNITSIKIMDECLILSLIFFMNCFSIILIN
jgi:hypothetical protein